MAAMIGGEMATTLLYRETIDRFDEERVMSNRYVSMITPQVSQVHMLEWENKQQGEDLEVSKVELSRLEESLAKIDSEQVAIREEMMALDSSTSTQKQQIALLEQLNQPVESDITFVFADRFNSERSGGHPAPSKNDPRLAERLSTKTSKSTAGDSQAKKMDGNLTQTTAASKRYRTGKMARLEARLRELTTTAKRNIQNLHVRCNDIARANKENQEEYQEEGAMVQEIKQIGDLTCEIDKVEQQSYFSVHEILRLRLELMVAQRIQAEAQEAFHEEEHIFQKKELLAKKALQDSCADGKAKLDAQLKMANEDFSKQLDEIAATTQKLNSLGKTVDKEIASGKLLKLQGKLRVCKGQYERLARRWVLEKEGYHAELAMLNKKIAVLQRKRGLSDDEIAAAIGQL
jgi:hypothetical protein